MNDQLIPVEMDLSDDTIDQANTLRGRFGVSNNTTAVSEALRITRTLYDLQAQGHEIIVRQPGRADQVMVLPGRSL